MRRLAGIGLAVILSVASYAHASDFATEVIEYVQGTGIPRDSITLEYFSNPSTALGRPTVDTTGDLSFTSGQSDPFPPTAIGPVVPVYQPFRSFELVSVGKNGGRLTLKFDHPVMNDPQNPYGIDLILFGNANQYLSDSSTLWNNGNPNQATVGDYENSEPQPVSVSQDGITWYTFTTGPYADSFAPTLGRVYDEVNPDASLGSGNLWWGQATDPTLPLPPALTAEFFANQTVAQMAKFYGQSAGGTGFDIAPTGWDWIQYIRIDNPSIYNSPEIDAVVDVAPRIAGDTDLNGIVNYSDFVTLKSHFGKPGGWNWGDFSGDARVGYEDFVSLKANFGKTMVGYTPEPLSFMLLGLGMLINILRKR